MDVSERVDEVATADNWTDSPEATAPERAVRVMTYNILSGGWPRRAAVEAVIRDAQADIIGLEEVESETLDALASRLGMEQAFSRSKRGSSVGLLSRWPLREVHPHVESPLRNAVLEVVVEPQGAQPLRIFVAHLAAHYAHWRAGEGERLRELVYILARMRETASDGVPQLLMGDFNSLPPGERLQASKLLLHAAELDRRRDQGERLEGLPGVSKVLPRPARPLADALISLARIPPLAAVCDLVADIYTPRAVVRRASSAGYLDLYTVTHPIPTEREGSCPSHDPAGRIDYIFASPSLAQRLMNCDLLSDTPTCPVASASDHRPMLTTLALAPALATNTHQPRRTTSAPAASKEG